MAEKIDLIEYLTIQLSCIAWGLDLEGTLQSAGGVGGLLFEKRKGQIFVPFYDANGNIVTYVDEFGETVAQREYDVFGNTVSATGPMVNDFNFWFSTKYLDHETGLYYYGYRFYSPEFRRFINRDPIEERGGVNLYGFAGNNPMNKWDYLGLIGQVKVTHWQPDKRSETRRSWLAGVSWMPPTDWKEKKAECLPCKKVVWTQKWNWHLVLLGGVKVYMAWREDWGEGDASSFGLEWVAGGKSSIASFHDSPGLESITGMGYIYQAIHIALKSTAKCVEGEDAGITYATFKWHVNWGRATDQIEASYEIED